MNYNFGLWACTTRWPGAAWWTGRSRTRRSRSCSRSLGDPHWPAEGRVAGCREGLQQRRREHLPRDEKNDYGLVWEFGDD
eukprot:3321022-Heterocapsa_arctica.AAC.1